MTDREIALKALGDNVTEAETRSDEYLFGQLDVLAAPRMKAQEGRQKLLAATNAKPEAANGNGNSPSEPGDFGTPIGGRNFLHLRADARAARK